MVSIYANNSKACRVLGWKITRTLDDMLEHRLAVGKKAGGEVIRLRL